MITIYHLPRTRSLRVIWLMEELGEPYRLERLSIPVSPEYLEVNPLGSIPAIDDDGIRMCESLAILQYITGRRLVAGVAEAAKLTVGPEPDPAAYAEHLQFLHFGEADLAMPLSAIFRTRMQVKDDAHTNPTMEELLRQLGKRLAFLDGHFGDGRPYVTGDGFTIADISIGYSLARMPVMGLGDMLSGRLTNYLARLQARPAYRRAAEQ